MMKKLLLILAFLFVPSVAWAQCTGVFPANTICGNFSGNPRPPGAFSLGGSVLTGPTSPTAGQFATYSSSQFTIIDQTSIVTSQNVNITGGVSLSTLTISPALIVANGGTGTSTFTTSAPILGNGTGALFQGTRTGNTTSFATATGSQVGCTQYDGNGNLTGTGSNCGNAGATSPGGSNTQIQYNNSGAFAGDARLTWNAGSGTLGLPDSATWTNASGISGVVGVGLAGSGKAISWAGQALQIVGSGGGAGASFLDINENGGNTFVRFHDNSASLELSLGSAGKYCWTNNASAGACSMAITGEPGSGSVFDFGNGGTHDKSGTVNLANLSASTQITLPDTGSFNTTFGDLESYTRIHAVAAANIPASPPASYAFIGYDPQGGGITLFANHSAQATQQGNFALQQMSFMNGTGFIVGNIQGGANSGGVGDWGVGIGRITQTAFSDNPGGVSVTGYAVGASQVAAYDGYAMGVITQLSNLVPGSGYTSGFYTGVALTGGSGSSAYVNVTVNSSGVVSSAVLMPATQNYAIMGGGGYVEGDVLSACNGGGAGCIGGAGSGFSTTVTSTNIAPNLGPVYIEPQPFLNYVGFGQNSAYVKDQTIRVGAETGGAFQQNPWDNTPSLGAVNLSISGQMQYTTTNGTTNLCEVQTRDTSGTFVVTACNPVATLTIFTSGASGTPGTYTNVAMTNLAGQSYGSGLTANLTVGTSGQITVANVGNNAGLGYLIGQKLTATTSSAAGNTSGFVLKVATLGSTPAPIKAAYFVPGTIYSSAGTQIPTCNASINGAIAVVSDSTSPITYRSAYTAGGTLQNIVLCINGTGWIND